MSSHPPAAKIFNDGMVVTNHAVALQVASAYDFAEIPTLVDVGGGTGSLIAALLESNSEMRGIIYDMKHATEDATNLLDERRLHERCEFVTGNFFQDIPKTHSCVLKSISHD